MAYEFKKLKDVVTIEVVTDKANVLIEENGVIKKVNKNEIAGKKEVSWYDLTDKPFEILSSETTEIIAPAEVNITSVDAWETVSDSALYCFNEGETYIVVFDGIEYKCEVEIHDSGDDLYLMLGNSSLGYNHGPNTGEPFILLNAWGSDWVHVRSTKFGSHIISVIQRNEIIKPIDCKFMPEGYPYIQTEMIEFMPETEVEVIVDEYGGVRAYHYEEEGSHVFSEGETYIVCYDGKEYICVAGSIDTGDDWQFVIGNGDLYNYHENSIDVPFACMNYTNGSSTNQYLYFTDPGTHTISISQKKETITPMDPRLIGNKPDLIITSYKGPSQKFNSADDLIITEGSINLIWDILCSGEKVPVIKIRYFSQDNSVRYIAELDGHVAGFDYENEVIYITYMTSDGYDIFIHHLTFYRRSGFHASGVRKITAEWI